MPISSRFSVGIHILTLIELNKEGVSSSDFLAGSVNTNPAVIRKIMGMLKKAGLIEVSPGIAGAKLKKAPSDITLLEIYEAVEVVQKEELFTVHESSNAACPVGRNIEGTVRPLFTAAQLALENALGQTTLDDIVKDVAKKETSN